MKRPIFALACCATLLAGCAGSAAGRCIPESTGRRRPDGPTAGRPLPPRQRRAGSAGRDPARPGLRSGTFVQLPDKARANSAAIIEDAAKARRPAGSEPRKSATCTPASWTRPRAEKLGLEPIDGRARSDRRDPGQGRARPRRGRPPNGRRRRPLRPDRRPPTPSNPTGTSSTSRQGGIGLPDETTIARRRQVQAHPRQQLRRPHREDARAGRRGRRCRRRRRRA